MTAHMTPEPRKNRLVSAPGSKCTWQQSSVRQPGMFTLSEAITARRYHAAWSSFAKNLVKTEVIEVNPLRSVACSTAQQSGEGTSHHA